MKKSRILLFTILFLAPIAVYASLFDTEYSSKNTFTADTLNIQFRTFDSTNIDLSNTENNVFAKLSNIGNMPNINYQKYIFVNGDQELASKINLMVSTQSIQIYEGKLIDFTLDNITLPKDTDMDILYGISISPEDLANTNGEIVTFKIQDIANQQGLVYPSGFNDVENLQITLTTPISEIESIRVEPLVTNIIDKLLETTPINENNI